MDLSFKVVIPARFKSTRLPGKPLVDIAGKSLLLRTFEQCLKAVPRENICVLTDDELILSHCKTHDMPAELTSKNCLTGTDRVAEYAAKTNFDFYINVQGDEPLMNPKDVIAIKEALFHSPTSVINGYCSISDQAEFFSLSVPKVVFNENGNLLYMSRAPIPASKNQVFTFGFRQVCVYGFPSAALKAFASRKRKARFEAKEDIEILRFLEMGEQVKMIELSSDSISVDHPEDIIKVLARL